MDNTEWVNVDQAAQILGRSRRTVFRWLPTLEKAGVRILRPSQRVLLIHAGDLAEFASWLAATEDDKPAKEGDDAIRN